MSFDKHHLEHILKIFFKGLIPLSLLFSGIVLLISKVSGWSLIAGLPLVVFGLVFSIYSYDEFLREEENFSYSSPKKCSICGRKTYNFEKIKGKIVCRDCKASLKD